MVALTCSSCPTHPPFISISRAFVKNHIKPLFLKPRALKPCLWDLHDRFPVVRLSPPKIQWQSLSPRPQSDETLTRNGEWFSSLLHRHMSRAEWNRAPSPFTTQRPKGGATNTTYHLTSRPCSITVMRFHRLITVGSIRLRSNGLSSSHSRFFR